MMERAANIMDDINTYRAMAASMYEIGPARRTCIDFAGDTAARTTSANRKYPIANRRSNLMIGAPVPVIESHRGTMNKVLS